MKDKVTVVITNQTYNLPDSRLIQMVAQHVYNSNELWHVQVRSKYVNASVVAGNRTSVIRASLKVLYEKRVQSHPSRPEWAEIGNAIEQLEHSFAQRIY